GLRGAGRELALGGRRRLGRVDGASPRGQARHESEVTPLTLTLSPEGRGDSDNVCAPAPPERAGRIEKQDEEPDERLHSQPRGSSGAQRKPRADPRLPGGPRR